MRESEPEGTDRLAATRRASYAPRMIRSLKGKATRQFAETGKSKFPGLDVELARQRLQELNGARSLDVISRLRSVGLHKLKGDRKAYWAIM
ncbi:MAG: type II toxin-antitoxin system RelE/ParE family toxin [Microvirga sp.]|jgi:toxin HigB-1